MNDILNYAYRLNGKFWLVCGETANKLFIKDDVYYILITISNIECSLKWSFNIQQRL